MATLQRLKGLIRGAVLASSCPAVAGVVSTLSAHSPSERHLRSEMGSIWLELATPVAGGLDASAWRNCFT